MASVINKIHGALMKPFTSISTDLGPALTGPVTYLWRAKILANRITSLKAQHIGLPTEVDPATKTPNTAISTITAQKRRAVMSVPKKFTLETPTTSTVKNQIVIVNPTAKTGENNTSYESIVIQGMPSEVSCESDNQWVVVRSMGRNNPFYMYTGSEDTISFDVSWYSIQEDRSDVIKKCRLLESWSKADGYKASPPELWISWGSAELFKDSTFILISAPYVLSNFQNAYRKSRKSEIIDLGLLPNVATQKLTFKRVTKENLSRATIQRVYNAVPETLPEPSVSKISKPNIPETIG